MTLKDKVALVTGASTGVGAATARLLAHEGARVAVNYLASEGAARAVAAAIEEAGGEAHLIRADVADRGQVQGMVRSVLGRWGGLHILVNNAGTLVARGAIADLPEEVWDQVVAVNLKGTFLCCQAAILPMKAAGWGRIINIASATARPGATGGGGSVHYSAAKGGVLVLSRGLARELAPFGITVNAVAPGIVDTPFHEKFSPPGAIAARVKELPIPRAGTPEEIARAVLFFCSAAADYITGATLDVNGGLVMP